MRSVSMIGFVALMALAGPTLANTAAPPQSFVAEAIEGDISEIMLGRLAAQRGDSKSVRDYGNLLSDDHIKAKDAMVALAGELGVKPPIAPTHEAQETYTRLSGLSGRQFDSEFVAYMIKDHQEDIAEFQKEADGGQDPKIKHFAATTLPTLQEHLRIAEKAASAVGASY